MSLFHRQRLPKHCKRLFSFLLGMIWASIFIYSADPPFSFVQSSTQPVIARSPTARLASVEDFVEAGRQAYRDQRFTDAVAAWSQAAEFLQALQAPSSQALSPQTPSPQAKPLEQALTLSYLSAAYQQLGQWDAAKSALSRSQSLLPTELNSSQAQQVSAQVYNTLGSLHFALGKTQQALETWQIAADLYNQIGEESRALNNLLNQIQAQQTLGYYHQVKETISRLEARLPAQELPLQIQGYQRLGQAYRLMGDLSAAQAHLQTALDLATTHSAGPILLELGNTAQAQGDLPSAISFYQRAIAQANQPDIRVKAKLNQLKLVTKTKSLSIEPLTTQNIITSLSTDITDLSPGRAQVYAYIHAAQSLLQHDSMPERTIGVQWLVQAIQQSIELQDSRAEAYAKGYLAHAYEISQQWSEAQSLTEEALTIAQTINANDIIYQWQWQLGRLLAQQHQRESALQAYRQAFSTLQLIRQDIVTTNQDLQFSFRDSVEPVYRELVGLLLQKDTERSVLNQAIQENQHDLLEAREVIESLQVAELDNFFRTACLAAQQVSLENVDQTAAAIIYPIILPSRLEIIVSLPGHPLQHYTTPITQSELEQTLTDWRQNIEKPFTTPEGKALGKTLHSWLIQPMQSALEEASIHTLVFIPDGALRNAPMAALYDGEQYLIEQYAVALSPGLQLLGPRALKEANVAALLAGMTQSRHGFSPLLNVEDELKTVQSLVSSRLLLDESFTTANLTQQVSRSNRPIVHLATHGQFSSDADKTFLLAWDRPIPVNELSALLKTGDGNRAEPIELLVLSACETANGDSHAALGLAGVALRSGTRSTLASLWNLDDASGAAFVEQFYQTLTRSPVTKAHALQQAQLAMLNNPDYRHPTYWAAYVLVGNWL